MSLSSLFNQEVPYTQAERVIIDFITAQPTDFLVMTIQQLAARLGVSDATISRFARHAGFRDFRELKGAVTAIALNTATKAEDDAAEKPDSPAAFLNRQRDCLDITVKRLDSVAFERAASAIASAPEVLIRAKGSSAACGELLRCRLARMGKRAQVTDADGVEILEDLVHLQKRDVMVIFAFHRLSDEGRVCIERARTVGATSVLVSSRAMPADIEVDVALQAYRGEPREYQSMTAAVALVDALAAQVTARLEETGDEPGRLRSLQDEYGSALDR